MRIISERFSLVDRHVYINIRINLLWQYHRTKTKGFYNLSDYTYCQSNAKYCIDRRTISLINHVCIFFSFFSIFFLPYKVSDCSVVSFFFPIFFCPSIVLSSYVFFMGLFHQSIFSLNFLCIVVCYFVYKTSFGC